MRPAPVAPSGDPGSPVGPGRPGDPGRRLGGRPAVGHDELGVVELVDDGVAERPDELLDEPLGPLDRQQVVDVGHHVDPPVGHRRQPLLSLDVALVPDRIDVEEHRPRLRLDEEQLVELSTRPADDATPSLTEPVAQVRPVRPLHHRSADVAHHLADAGGRQNLGIGRWRIRSLQGRLEQALPLLRRHPPHPDPGATPGEQHDLDAVVDVGQVGREPAHHPLDAGPPPRAQRVGHLDVDDQRTARPGRRSARRADGLEPAADMVGGAAPRDRVAPGAAGRERHRDPDPNPRHEQLEARLLQPTDLAEHVLAERPHQLLPGRVAHPVGQFLVAVAERRQHPVPPIQEEEPLGPVPAGGAVGMVDDRLRHGDGAPPAPPGPPRQVGVLVVGEEPRVEQSDLDQHLPAQQHPTAAEAANRPADDIVAIGLGEVPVVALAASVSAVPRPLISVVRRAGTSNVISPGEVNAPVCVAPPRRESTPQSPRAGEHEPDLLRALASGDPDPRRSVDPPGDQERPGLVVVQVEAVVTETVGHVEAVDLHRRDVDVALTDRVRLGADQIDVDRHELGLQQQLGCRGPRRRVRLERVHERTQPTRFDHRIVVDQGHVLHVAEVAHGPVAALGEPEVLAVLDHLHIGEPVAELLEGPVDGPVVDQDDLEPVGRVVGALERPQAPARVPRRVPVEDDDPDTRQSARHRRAAGWSDRRQGRCRAHRSARARGPDRLER